MLASVETYNPAKAIEYWNNCGARSKRPNFLESTNSTTAKSVSNLQIVKAPISDSNENHIGNVEFEEVIALSDSEYSDTDSLSESRARYRFLIWAPIQNARTKVGDAHDIRCKGLSTL